MTRRELLAGVAAFPVLAVAIPCVAPEGRYFAKLEMHGGETYTFTSRADLRAFLSTGPHPILIERALEVMEDEDGESAFKAL